MKSLFVVASLSATATAVCNLMCAGIYTLDLEKCECVPIEYMECHPQYNVDCNQYAYDKKAGRDPNDNPYKSESWYQDSLCDTVCTADKVVDEEACKCISLAEKSGLLDESGSMGTFSAAT